MEHSNENYVILVDEKDNQIGTMEKIEAHEKARLHRAFSVFIYNSKNELMLQQRALTKYHTPGLWTNTCCSHQKLEESNIEAGKRRLQEEMGFSTELKETISFIYKAPFENGLTEHEFDYILVGEYQDDPQPNPDEVHNWKWMNLDDIENDMNKNPNLYTEWFKIIFEKHKSEMVKSST
jgi:isopentenyl-diphosphate delta-isomerase